MIVEQKTVKHSTDLFNKVSVVYGTSNSNTECMTGLFIIHLLMMLIYFVSELKVGCISCEGPNHTGGLFSTNNCTIVIIIISIGSCSRWTV